MTPEIPPLVVGIDGSERSDAFALAARLADPDQHVLLVHVRRDDRSANLTALRIRPERSAGQRLARSCAPPRTRVVVVPAGSAAAHHADPAAPAITQPDPGA
jgi:hypothetical protein